MTRTMYDSISVNAPPTNGDLYAGYVGGAWPTYEGLRKRFPNKPVVSIAVASTQNAIALDVEPGDSTPQLAPGWAVRQRANGFIPCVYTEYSMWKACRDQFAFRGVAEPLWWIALYDNLPILEEGIYQGRQVSLAGVIAKQYDGNSRLNYDYSVVADTWPGVDTPHPGTGDSDMTDDERQMLTECHQWLDQIVNGAPGFGVLPGLKTITYTARTVDNVARKLLVPVADDSNPAGT